MKLNGTDRPTVPWYEEDPERLSRELAALSELAPELTWTPDFEQDSPAAMLRLGGGWTGRLPVWPFDRPAPDGLERWLPQGMAVAIACSPAHPVAIPRVWPIEPDPPPEYRANHSWHLNYDGSLCLFLRSTDWTGRELTSEIVHKACGWFLEYQIMLTDSTGMMTVRGIAESEEFDGRLAELALVELDQR